jgi:polysaccharide export outer membrane protein
MFKIILLVAGCGALASCASTPKYGVGPDGSPSAVRFAEGATLAPPTAADLFTETRPYLIGPFDKLTIDVFGIEDLSKKEVQADAGGRFSFPLAGAIEAAGKTPADVAQIIEQRLRGRFVKNPQVTVNVTDTMSQVVTVDGQVKQPGIYPVVGRTTLMRAIAMAKGLDEFAKLSDIVIFRTVNGQKMAALYNLGAIRAGVYEDPEVYASDIVVVGDSKARRLFKDLLQTVPLITTPLIVFLQRN